MPLDFWGRAQGLAPLNGGELLHDLWRQGEPKLCDGSG